MRPGVVGAVDGEDEASGERHRVEAGPGQGGEGRGGGFVARAVDADLGDVATEEDLDAVEHRSVEPRHEVVLEAGQEGCSRTQRCMTSGPSPRPNP